MAMSTDHGNVFDTLRYVRLDRAPDPDETRDAVKLRKEFTFWPFSFKSRERDEGGLIRDEFM
jgi:hypothetical protein